MPTFRNVYDRLAPAALEQGRLASDDKRWSFSAAGVPLGSVAQILARYYGVSIVLGDGLEKREVVAEFQSVTLPTALEHIAKRLGVGLRVSEDVYYLGDLDRADRVTWVGRCYRLPPTELRAVLMLVGSGEGSVSVVGDGVVVVADRPAVVEEMRRVMRELENQPAGCWVVQYYVVSLRSSDLAAWGIDGSVTAGLSASLASGLGISDVSASLTALLEASRSKANGISIQEPLVLVSDGETVTFSRTERIPYRSFVQDVDGAVASRIQRIDFVDVGFNLETAIERIDGHSARLKASIRSDSVTSREDGLPPSTRGESLDTVAVIRSGGLYLLGAFDGVGVRSSDRWGLPLKWNRDNESVRSLVWARVYQVGSVADREAAGAVATAAAE